jgi:ADP-heptose:LPS heptosyltransferase
VRAGFTHYRSRFVYNRIIPRAQEILRVDRKVHTAEHLASAMFFLGVPQAEIPRASLFAPRDKAGQRPALLKGIPTEIGVERGSMRHPVETRNDGPPACRVERSATGIFHAVAATPEKTWPAARFLEVARHLDQSGIEPIFIGAPADDLTPFAAYRTIQGASLSEVMTLLASASLFVGNDSGPAHMAAAFGLPTVVLFGPSDPEIWGPWRTAGEVLRDPAGLAAVPASRVIEALDRLRVHA